MLNIFALFKKFVAKIHLAHSLCAKVANPVKTVTKLPQIPLPPTSASKEQISIGIISERLPFSIPWIPQNAQKNVVLLSMFKLSYFLFIISYSFHLSI